MGWKGGDPATDLDDMTMHFVIHTRSCLTIALLGLAACDLGPKSIGGPLAEETGDEAETSESEGETSESEGEGDTGITDPVFGSCGEETESIITNLDEVPPGFSASVAQLLEQATGVYNGTFTWAENDGPAMVAHAGTMASFELFVDYIGGEVRLTEVEFAGDYPDGDGGEPCSNRLEIVTRTEFMTDDGLFDEVFEQPLIIESHASDPDPRFYFTLDFASFAGMLQMTDFAFEDGVVEEVYFLASFPGATVNGSLAMEVEFMDFVGFGVIASFTGSEDANP